MKIVFFLRHPGYTRNFESTLALLAERGHHVHVAFDTRRKIDAAAPDQVERLGRESEGRITHEFLPPFPKTFMTRAATGIRLFYDYLRYLEPEYTQAVALRQRAARQLPRPAVMVANPLRHSHRGRRGARVLLRHLMQALPVPGHVPEILRRHRPDAVLVSPLIGLGSAQAEYVAAARRLGIPSCLCVASWDNLTNKGLLKQVPDLVTVWNEAQRREAIEMHDVPPDRVVATGAQAYDHWFDWRPSTTREEFCNRLGVRPDRPILLYLGSSGFIAPNEASFVDEWIRRIRSSDDSLLREAGVIVRPHPHNVPKWPDGRPLDLSSVENAVIWPAAGANPTNERLKSDYFDSIHHAAIVVGINTSALIESAIVGRRVFTLLAPEFHGTQEGTLHFHYLVRLGGGMLVAARTYEEHIGQLAAAIRSETRSDVRRGFLEEFIRPHGLDEPGTPRLVAAIESLVRPSDGGLRESVALSGSATIGQPTD